MGTGKTSLVQRFIKGQFHEYEVQFISISLFPFTFFSRIPPLPQEKTAGVWLLFFAPCYSILVLFLNFEFQESTIGAAFFTQILSLNEGTVKFDIWDTAGQERYHSLAPMYYRGAAAAVVTYDITNMVCILLPVTCYNLLNMWKKLMVSKMKSNSSLRKDFQLLGWFSFIKSSLLSSQLVYEKVLRPRVLKGCLTNAACHQSWKRWEITEHL